jgi:hypothetical protein
VLYATNGRIVSTLHPWEDAMTPKFLVAVTVACLAFAPVAMAQTDTQRSTTVKSSKSNTSDRMGGGGGKGTGAAKTTTQGTTSGGTTTPSTNTIKLNSSRSNIY